MNRVQYILFADTIKASKLDKLGKCIIASEFADLFKRLDDDFIRSRFLTECGTVDLDE